MLLGLLLAAGAGGAAGAGERCELRVAPTDIPVSVFFHGATVQIDAEVAAGYDVVVVCQGKEGALTLNKRGKRGRLVWMIVGEVTFQRVPTVYQVLSTQALER